MKTSGNEAIQQLFSPERRDDEVVTMNFPFGAINIASAPLAIEMSCKSLGLTIVDKIIDKGWFYTNGWYKVKGNVREVRSFVKWLFKEFQGEDIP